MSQKLIKLFVKILILDDLDPVRGEGVVAGGDGEGPAVGGLILTSEAGESSGDRRDQGGRAGCGEGENQAS